MKSRIPYFDYNATTPVDEEVLQAMLPYFSQSFGNASSYLHSYGKEAAYAVDAARSAVSNLINCVPEELVFTSGATESINLALRGLAEAYVKKGQHIITAATEHKAVLDTCASLTKKGISSTILSSNSDGSIDLQELEDAIQPSTIAIAIMYANNETGVIHPVSDISAIARKHGVLFFCDATQAAGKIPVDVIRDGIDIMAFSSHKLYGPKGCGALYVRRKDPRVKLTEQITGGGHESNRRSGTLNVPGIVGFGKAAEICIKQLVSDSERTQRLKAKFEEAVCKVTGATINGNSSLRLPNTSNLCFHLPNGSAFVNDLNKLMAVSSGSACSTAKAEASHVLDAMGLNQSQIKSSVRFSFGRYSTEEEVLYAIDAIGATAAQHH